MKEDALVVTVVGAGGKMGMRVSANLERSSVPTRYCEMHPSAQDRVLAAGRELSDLEAAVVGSNVVILAVPDIVLGEVSESIVAPSGQWDDPSHPRPRRCLRWARSQPARYPYRRRSPLPPVDIS